MLIMQAFYNTYVILHSLVIEALQAAELLSKHKACEADLQSLSEQTVWTCNIELMTNFSALRDYMESYTSHIRPCSRQGIARWKKNAPAVCALWRSFKHKLCTRCSA